jgi:hypothetical protein
MVGLGIKDRRLKEISTANTTSYIISKEYGEKRTIAAIE